MAEWHIGRVVKALRDERRWNNAQLAVEVGISAASVHNFFRRDQWAPEYIYRAARALGVNAHWLTTGEGPKYPDTDPWSINNPHVERAIILFTNTQRQAQMDFVDHILKLTKSQLDEPGGVATAAAKPVKQAAKRKR